MRIWSFLDNNGALSLREGRYIRLWFTHIVTNMYIMAGFSSNDFYGSQFSVMKWVQTTLSQKMFRKFGSVMNLFRQNQLYQKYTYNNSNICLNGSIFTLGAWKSSGWIFKHSSWQNRWSSTEYVGFLAQPCFFSTVHMVMMCLKSGLYEGHSKSSILTWLRHSFSTFDVCLGSLYPRDNLLLMIWGFPEEFGDNPPSLLFHLLFLEQQIHWQQNSPTA